MKTASASIRNYQRSSIHGRRVMKTGHRLLPWHKPFFFGATAQTLDPAYQADLEAEANYAAGRLLFLGNRFTEEARDLAPTIEAKPSSLWRIDTAHH